MPPPERIAIIVGGKGRGSNMAALADACSTGEIPAVVGVVIAPSEEIPAVQTAKHRSLPVSINPPDAEEYSNQLLKTLRGANVSYICLAGYLRLLPSGVLEAYPDRILNVHPALLPNHGGKGMYGMNVHKAVIAAQDIESGCTVHLVNERYDEGRILLQMRCPVLPEDTPESLAARVLCLEHTAYPAALKTLIENES